MSGRDIYSMQHEGGAVAVQLGTAFLPCAECGTTHPHRRYILHEPERETVFTKAFSGRAARGIANSFISCMDGANILPFPFQNTLTAPMRAQAVKAGDGERMSLWVGSNYTHARKRIDSKSGNYCSVAELMKQLQNEFNTYDN